MSPQIHKPKVWIVIPTYNRRGDLLKCLDSVLNLEGYDNFEVVVVDNGSEDNSAADVRNHYPQVHVIDLPDNRGAAVASNIGLSYAYERNADYFLRLDSDTTLAPTSLSRFIEEAKNRPDAGVLRAELMKPPKDSILIFLSTMRILTFVCVFAAQDSIFGTFHRPSFGIKLETLHLSSQCAYQWGRGKMLLFRKHSKGFHRAALILFAYSYAVGRAIWPKPNVGNRGPLWDALRGLTNGLFQRILE